MKNRTRGFSLIEVLVAMAVVAFGLLAIATFQSGLMKESGSNKARSEALAIAQARIEQFRNYSDNSLTQTNFDQAAFDTLFASTTNFVSETNIPGTNATFTPWYKITGSAGSVKQIDVKVTWTDRDNTSQNVMLNTQIGWQSPRSVGDIAKNTTGTLIPSATGRAKLGDGTIDPNAAGVSLQSDNVDGTQTYRDNADLKLIYGTNVDGSRGVVLTLKDACKTGTCTDFVKIKGRVYIDTTSQTTLQPKDIFVKASDAAYCSRYYSITANGATTNYQITSTTTKADTPNSANGNYEYFDYVCYIGGGWYGNIGILLTGGIALTDKICLGDPTNAEDWAEPVIASRRAYRGMLYKADANGNVIRDANNAPIYYSVGVRDGITLPDPDVAGSKGHDYVIAKMNASDTAGTSCGIALPATTATVGPLTRTDSKKDASSAVGTLFQGTPADFYCLNGNKTVGGTTTNNAWIDFSATSPLPSPTYSARSVCPFDPTVGSPVKAYYLTGRVAVLASRNDLVTIPLLSNGMRVNTSDGPGNCRFDDPFAWDSAISKYAANYRCDIYDWGSGWNGSATASYVQASPSDPQVVCSPNTVSRTGVTADSPGADILNCIAGEKVEIKGAVTLANATKDLAGATMTGGVCTVTPTSYSCITVVNGGASWNGSITFTSNGGVICNTNGATTEGTTVTVNYTGAAGALNAPKPAGTYTQNFSIETNANACSVVP